MKMRMLLGLMVFGVLAALTGCGAGDGGTPAAGDGEAVVTLKSMAFEKRSLEVKAGTTVTWVNRDQVLHSVADGAPDKGHNLFKSDDFGYGQSFSYTFEKPGTYEITCPTDGHWLIGMKMKVIVR